MKFWRKVVYSLAVDIGGTFLKAALIGGGKVHQVIRRSMPAFIDGRGEAGAPGYPREIDGGALDVAIEETMSEALRGNDWDGRVFLSGQMAGLAFVDDAGMAVAPLISWQDTRYESVDKVAEALGPDVIANLGDGLRVGSPVVTLAGHNRPPGCYVTSLLAYAAGRIAGARATNVHVTDASSWGLLDLRRGMWSPIACSVAGLNPKELPRVVSELEPVVAGSGVFVPVGDQQAALLGAGLERNWLSVNLATGCQVSTLADRFDSAAQTRPYFGDRFGGRYLHTVTHLPAGRLLTSHLRAARGFEDWEWLSGAGMLELDAVGAVVGAIKDAALNLGATGRPVLFTGGLLQRLPALQALIASAVEAPEIRVFTGDDAAVAGTALLATVMGDGVNLYRH